MAADVEVAEQGSGQAAGPGQPCAAACATTATRLARSGIQPLPAPPLSRSSAEPGCRARGSGAVRAARRGTGCPSRWGRYAGSSRTAGSRPRAARHQCPERWRVPVRKRAAGRAGHAGPGPVPWIRWARASKSGPRASLASGRGGGERGGGVTGQGRGLDAGRAAGTRERQRRPDAGKTTRNTAVGRDHRPPASSRSSIAAADQPAQRRDPASGTAGRAMASSAATRSASGSCAHWAARAAPAPWIGVHPPADRCPEQANRIRQ